MRPAQRMPTKVLTPVVAEHDCTLHRWHLLENTEWNNSLYGRLSDDNAKDYEILKKALFRRYVLTEEGFHKKFRNTAPEEGESPAQFIVKLKNFLKKRMEQAGAYETFAELQQLVIKEQFINAVSNALEVYVKERAPAKWMTWPRQLSSTSQLMELSYVRRPSVPPPEMDVAKIDACIKEENHFLENGFAVPCLNACIPSNEDSMPVTEGQVGSHIVQVLRDSGCSSVEVCLPDTPYDLQIGNVLCARPAGDPDPAWQDTCDQETCAVATRAQAMREGKRPSPLVVPGSNLYKEVDRDKICRLQEKDDTLKKFWTSKEEREGRQVFRFETRKQLLYRTFVYPDINHGNPVSQVMVPKPLRTQVMTLAHESTLGGHLCAKKTKEKILREFYWSGMGADMTRFCRSSDICQKTISKGWVTKVPFEKLPIIDTPFKRVSVDIIGKIHPPSEKGHQFILTMMDHASRYPDAVPLKNIDSELVAEALVDMFSRVGVPEEILSDLGTQFTSDCMKEVARQLSMRQLTTTPYVPIEVPQELTGFSSFEILYGRPVRGLMQILMELWTKDIEEPEVKSSYQYVFELREKMEETMKLENEALKLAQGRYKHYFDRISRP
ncbi:uncharacterized protein [Palaemon carinicauda]|uniref:uncharacterized protein n=1 Tax=Palaemon carinicauda TaxID=392227 RepID=UPI0035B5BBEC